MFVPALFEVCLDLERIEHYLASVNLPFSWRGLFLPLDVPIVRLSDLPISRLNNSPNGISGLFGFFKC